MLLYSKIKNIPNSAGKCRSCIIDILTMEKNILEYINSYITTVKYDDNLREMIAACLFNWINSFVTEARFPLPPEFANRRVQMLTKQFIFDHEIGDQEVAQEMKLDNFVPATLPELFAFGAINPELQRHFPVVALPYLRAGDLSEHINKRKLSVYLDADNLGRGFRVDHFTHKRGTEFIFLGVQLPFRIYPAPLE